MYRVLAELAAHCVSFEIVAILAELAERAEGTFRARSLPSNGTTLAIMAMWTCVDVPAHCREAVEARELLLAIDRHFEDDVAEAEGPKEPVDLCEAKRSRQMARACSRCAQPGSRPKPGPSTPGGESPFFASPATSTEPKPLQFGSPK